MTTSKYHRSVVSRETTGLKRAIAAYMVHEKDLLTRRVKNIINIFVPVGKTPLFDGSASIQLIMDEQEPVKSMADGKMYTSKSAMRREQKARGFEEVGDQKSYMENKKYEPTDPTEDIKKAAYQLYGDDGVRKLYEQ